jgi:K+-transporting ATPase c subunit
MRGLRSITKVSVFVLLTGLFFLYPSASTSYAEDSFQNEVASFFSVKGDDEMAGMKRQSHFLRSSRYLLARMREQKIAFINRNAGKSSQANKVSAQAEAFANEANMLASQGEYEDGIRLLVKAHDIVIESLKETGGN